MNPVLLSVDRACQRSAALVHEDMRQGLYSLATIASVAPLVGLLGTVIGISQSFGSIDDGRQPMTALLAGQLAESLLTIPLGLIVGVFAAWSYRYLAERLNVMDGEMDNARLAVLNELRGFRGRFALTGNAASERMFGGRTIEELEQEQKFVRRSRITSGAMLALAWSAQALIFLQAFPSQGGAAIAACTIILVIFGIAYVPSRVIWIKALRRRRGGLLLAASSICLCWCIVEAAFALAQTLPH